MIKSTGAEGDEGVELMSFSSRQRERGYGERERERETKREGDWGETETEQKHQEKERLQDTQTFRGTQTVQNGIEKIANQTALIW